MSVHSSSTPSSFVSGYTSEGNQLRRAVSPPAQSAPAQSAVNNNTSPFAAVFAEQKAPAAATTSSSKGQTPQLLMPPRGNADAREVAVRAHTIAQVDMDKKRMQALDQLSQNMKGSDSLLDVARNDVTMRNLRSAIGSFGLKAPVMPMENSIKSSALQQAQRNMMLQTKIAPRQENTDINSVSMPQASHGVNAPELGKLSSQFEAAKDGISAIGYDRVGGTSYGKYQIASRVGSMDKFLNFLDTAAPDMAGKLRDAGPANTGGRKGAMPEVWRELAEQEPDRFEALQDKFIYDSHYKPALAAISKQTSMDEGKISSVMQEVLWSTAVQHGPSGAAKIFSRATAGVGSQDDENFDKRVINNIYEIRAGQFASSTEAVQDAVRNRMRHEKSMALNMLKENAIA